MKDLIQEYVKRVRDLAEHVKGNEQATKQSLIGPLFTFLGYDLTDPRECIPEYRADFGKERSTKPVDWAFLQNGKPIFFVEAKDVGKRLAGYDEQLADYFAKAPEAKLGILTNGMHWRFFTDSENTNVMDHEPFLEWNIENDEQPPIDLLTLMRKGQYNPELLRTYAQRKRAKNLLISELNRLLEPSPEFTKLAIANIETRNLTANVVDSWKPVLASAIEEWARQCALSAVLAPNEDSASSNHGISERSRIETTQEELDAYELVKRLLDKNRPVQYEDTASYFKVHLPEQPFWAVCRFYFGKRRLAIWVSLPIEEVSSLVSGFEVSKAYAGWSNITLTKVEDIKDLKSVLCAAWDCQNDLRGKNKVPSDESDQQK